MSDEQTDASDTGGSAGFEKQKEDDKFSKPLSKVEEAREERKRLEELTKKLKEENDRTERLAAERALGGDDDVAPKPKPKEPESAIEYAKRLEQGEANPFADDGIN